MSVAALLGTAWGGLAGVWLWSGLTARGPRSARALPAAGGLNPPGGRQAEPVGAWVGSRVKSLLAALGRPLRHRLLSDTHQEADTLAGFGLLAGGVAALLLHPVVAVVPVGVALGWHPVRARRAARYRAAAVVDHLPDVIDLLRLTTLAGLPVSAAVTAIGSRPGGEVGSGLQHVAQQLERGASTGTALESLAARCGAPINPLVDVLLDHDRYGTPLGPALDRVGIECRLRRRRQAEEAARKLPVTLLFPLVLTTLPACVLLTVVPLVVSSLSTLSP